jgi:hypothetical protein
MSTALPKTASTPTLNDLRTTVELHTHRAAMRTTKKATKKNASIPYAQRVANKTPEGQLRRGTTTYRTENSRLKAMHLFNSADRSLMGDDLMIVTLKYIGGKKKLSKIAPNDESVNGHIEYFDFALSEETGAPVPFLWFKDFNELGGAVHIHMLISRAIPAELIHAMWAIATGQDDDYKFDEESQTGIVSWKPEEIESYYGQDAEETFMYFCRYEGRKYNPATGKGEKKVAQKRVNPEWIRTGNYRVQWAGLSKAATPATPLTVNFTCTCGNLAVRKLMQEQTTAPRDIVQFDCREFEGEQVDIDLGRWSFDALDKGATEYCDITDEMREAVLAIEAEHAGCTGPAPVAAEEAPVAPAAAPKSSTPAEALTASSASTATPLTTKESITMSEINKELKTLFTAEEIEAIRDRAEEKWAKENFPVISIEQRHAELEAVKADPNLTYTERERLVALGTTLLDSTINTMVNEEMADLTDEDRIALGAEKVTARFGPIIPHLALVAPAVVDEFAALSPLDQFDELLAPVTPVEIPRIASDPHARRPRYVAGLTTRTAADIAYLAAFVRIERSVDSMMSDEITMEDHVENYAREINVINGLMSSGSMTPIPVEWVEARRAGVL